MTVSLRVGRNERLGSSAISNPNHSKPPTNNLSYLFVFICVFLIFGGWSVEPKVGMFRGRSPFPRSSYRVQDTHDRDLS